MLNPGDQVNRKQWLRETLQSPQVAAIWPHTAKNTFPPESASQNRIIFLDVYSTHSDLAVIRTDRSIDAKPSFYLTVFNPQNKSWESWQAVVQWVAADPFKHTYQCYAATISPLADESKLCPWHTRGDMVGPLLGDYEFFRSVPFLKAIHREAVCPLLNSMTYRRAWAGEQFITQDHAGEACYIVQSGRCRVVIEKSDCCHMISRIGPGEFVGEMALLTGERRSAHVIAESDVELWTISRDSFQGLIDAYPEVGTFLTEIMAERFASRTLTADRTIGKYKVTDIIGRGGYAIVYKGCHMDLNRPVAIKMLNHDMALNQDFLDNFRKEARTIASLNHENIIKIYDIEARYRTVFIIMELLEGKTLRQLLRATGKLAIRDAVEVILQVGSGLTYAHAQGLVHQDIKPGNIFILPDGSVKILDFGLACACGAENFLVGTPFYMAPEQIECLPVDERADIFALGLTAYEMVTGTRPFEEENPFKVMNLHVEQPIPDAALWVPEIPDELRSFIRKACSRQPDERYANVSQAMGELTPLAAELGLGIANAVVPRKKMSTLFLFYREDQELVLNRLLEAFSEQVKREGIVLKAADFENI